ncbi:Flp family type IVb pilin [Rhizobiaceae bacterium]|nr:Flp family type IVb pilin [Rhizobiaceae bacterium]
MTIIAKFFKDESGATAIEYGLLAALISVAAVGTLGTLGSNLDGTMLNVSNEMAKGKV